jgi:peptidoglycan/LPS O-acetylase OafA/YrhL
MDLLTITRGLLAVSVVIWHSAGTYNMIPFFVNIPGRVAVWIFFGISGYVICYGFIKSKYKFNTKDLRDFYINRLLKIYPLFLFMGFLAWLTEFALNQKSPIKWSDVPAEFFGLQFEQNYKLNGIFWTLGIELQFYLIAPFILFPILSFCKEKSFRLFVIFVFYISILFSYAFYMSKSGWNFDGRNILANLCHFIAGIFACIASYQIPPKRLTSFFSFILTLSLTVISAWLYKNQPGVFWSFAGILLVDTVILSLIILHASLQETSKTYNSSIYKSFIFLGTISYSVYAWHAYILKFFPIRLDESLLNTFFLFIPISIFVASLSYLFIETPFQKLRRIQRPLN